MNGCNLVMADSTIMNTHLLCHQGVDPFRCNFPGCTAVGWVKNCSLFYWECLLLVNNQKKINPV